VLGQAKCQVLDRPTHGRDIARTVARLRRGRLGVYVTTSFFSSQTQREVIEDRYPTVDHRRSRGSAHDRVTLGRPTSRICPHWVGYLIHS